MFTCYPESITQHPLYQQWAKKYSKLRRELFELEKKRNLYYVQRDNRSTAKASRQKHQRDINVKGREILAQRKRLDAHFATLYSSRKMKAIGVLPIPCACDERCPYHEKCKAENMDTRLKEALLQIYYH